MSTAPARPGSPSPSYLMEDCSRELIAAVITILTLSTILLALRLYARFLTKADRGWDEFLLPPAWILIVGVCVTNIRACMDEQDISLTPKRCTWTDLCSTRQHWRSWPPRRIRCCDEPERFTCKRQARLCPVMADRGLQHIIARIDRCTLPPRLPDQDNESIKLGANILSRRLRGVADDSWRTGVQADCVCLGQADCWSKMHQPYTLLPAQRCSECGG